MHDLGEIDEAAAKITVHGARYPEKLEKMTGLSSGAGIDEPLAGAGSQSA